MINANEMTEGGKNICLPVLRCQSSDFFDMIEELSIGQVLIVTRYSKSKKEIINETWIRYGNTTYGKIENTNLKE